MKYLFLLIFIYSSIFSQQALDSVLGEIANLPDEEKVEHLSQLCWSSRNSSPKLALQYANKALKISNANSLFKFEPILFNYKGVIERNICNYDEAIKSYNKALELAEELKDSTQIAYALNNLGGIYRLQGLYPLALDYILRAITFFEQKKDKSGAAFCAINIGIIFRYQQNYPKALEYLNYCLKIREELNYEAGIALTLSQLAIVYVETEQYSKALEAYNNAEKVYKKLNDTKGIASVLSGYGNLAYSQKNYSTALRYTQRALSLDKNMKNIDGEMYDLILLGKIYRETGELELSNEYTSYALEHAQRTNSKSSELKALLEMSKIYEQKSDPSSAYKYYKEYTKLKDSLFSELNSKQIAEKQSSYEIVKQIQENQSLKENIQQQSTQKNYLIVIFFLVLVIAIVLFLRFKQVSEIKQLLEDANNTKDKFLNILAHDLRNPFNATLGYTNLLLNDYHSFSDEEKIEMLERIDESVHRNLDLLENLLNWALLQRENIDFQPAKINLFDIAQTTISHLKYNADEKKIALYNNIPKHYECLADNYMILAVFRNIISNSIKFTNSGGFVEVNAHFNNKEICVSIEDNGIGIDEENLDKLFKIDSKFSSKGTEGENGTGLGLILCKEFIEKNEGTLKVSSNNGIGTSIKFTLPIYIKKN